MRVRLIGSQRTDAATAFVGGISRHTAPRDRSRGAFCSLLQHRLPRPFQRLGVSDLRGRGIGGRDGRAGDVPAGS